MNQHHRANYIVYNLYPERQFENATSIFHSITEYSIPRADLVLQASDNSVKFMTPPPALRHLFLIVLEMASWINSNDREQNIILLH